MSTLRMALKPQDELTIRSASPVYIVEAAKDIRTFLASGEWLSPTSPYLTQITHVLDGRLGPHVIQPQDLLQYMAASAPLHCLDGWRYLGRAIDSHVRCDTASAVHLGYYAELRAAMALLATQGIGVYSQRHIVFDAAGSHSIVKGRTAGPSSRVMGTHVFAWEALNTWGESPATARLLGRMVTVRDHSLEEWLTTFSPGYSGAGTASKWLSQWGLDLSRLAEDRDNRNEVSYQPSVGKSVAASSAIASASSLTELWSVFEPLRASRFESIDQFLLRSAIHDAYTSVSVASPLGSATLQRRVDQAVTQLGIQEPAAGRVSQFLVNPTNPADPDLLTEARQRGALGSPGHHLQVISRAALMLRIATGAVALLLSDAGIGRDELGFWWRPLIEGSGFWEPDDGISSLDAMWGDVGVAISDLRLWANDGTGGAVSSTRQWHEANAKALLVLSGCERIGLWGLKL